MRQEEALHTLRDGDDRPLKQFSVSDDHQVIGQDLTIAEEEDAHRTDLHTHSVLVLHLELLEDFPLARMSFLQAIHDQPQTRKTSSRNGIHLGRLP